MRLLTRDSRAGRAPATGRPRRSTDRLAQLRGSAPGFRNPTSCIARSLLEAGGFRLQPVDWRVAADRYILIVRLRTG